jgi:DNA end-binding protein Ku
LNYQYKVRDIGELDELKSSVKLSEQEMKLAKTLMDQLYNSDFNMSKFKDTFKEQLLEVIDKKSKGEFPKIRATFKPEKNLIKALRESLK